MKPGESQFQRINLDQAFDVYSKANPAEKQLWFRMLMKKWSHADGSTRRRMINQFRDAIKSHKEAQASLPAALAPGASSGLPGALARNARRAETALL